MYATFLTREEVYNICMPKDWQEHTHNIEVKAHLKVHDMLKELDVKGQTKLIFERKYTAKCGWLKLDTM